MAELLADYYISLKMQIKQFQIYHYIAVIMAITLQIQVTVLAQGDYLGLRVSLADMLLPFCGVFVLYSLIRGKSRLPIWSVSHMLLWLCAIVLVMSTALLNGYINNGFLSNWAFINKYIGFLILISYLVLGGWIVTNVRSCSHVLSVFVNIFVGFFVLSLAMSVIILFLQYFISYPLWLADYPWDGLMANRNAYMVVFIMVFIFVIWSYAKNGVSIPVWPKSLFWFCMPIFFVFNDSRTGWIISLVLAIVFFSRDTKSRMKSVTPILFVAVLVSYLSFYITTSASSYVLEGRQVTFLIDAVKGNGDEYIGDNKRYIAIEDGMELHLKYDKLVGAGLGAYKPFQIAKRGEFIEVMDFTALWLLVETGAVGLLVFSGFFIACALALYRRGYVNDGGGGAYYRATLAFIIAFAAISILHEVMYTRFVWFALGLGVARGRAYN